MAHLKGLPEGWPHRSYKARKANVTVCPKILSVPNPPKLNRDKKPWPPIELDRGFTDMISQYKDVFVDELSKDETIFAPT